MGKKFLHVIMCLWMAHHTCKNGWFNFFLSNAEELEWVRISNFLYKSFPVKWKHIHSIWVLTIKDTSYHGFFIPLLSFFLLSQECERLDGELLCTMLPYFYDGKIQFWYSWKFLYRKFVFDSKYLLIDFL